MTIFDTLFLLLFAVLLPAYSFVQYRKMLRETPQLLAENRQDSYRSTIFFQWLLWLAAFILWIVNDRAWAELGFKLEIHGGFWLAAGIVIISLSYFYRQLQQGQSGEQEIRDKLRKEFGDVGPLLPHNQSDLRLFYGVSLTAGIIEEILFRGFLIWYMGQLMPIWAAALIGIVLFALVHSYQGAKQFPALLAVSAVLMVVFLLSGSLWLPMILHTLVDVLQGKLAYEIMSDDDLIEAAEAGAENI